MGWIGVLTNAGADMIAQLAGGSHTLTITKATIATGTVAEANLRTQTALTSEVGNISIVKKEEITGGVKIRVRVPPATSVGYIAHQIGIWGKIDNGTVKLIQIHQDSGTGIAIPTEAESPEFLFDYIAVLAVSNTSSLTITVDPDVYASMDDLDDGLAEKLDKDQGSANAGKFLKVGNDGTVTPEAVSIDTSGKLDSNQIAPAYSNAATYAVGDRCTHNGKVWKCGTAIVTPEEWDPTHWTAGDDVDTLLAEKLDKDQGSGNAGKFMKVGNDGELFPADLPVQAPNALSLTLVAGSWSSATPPTQTVSATGVTANNNIIVGLASTATSAQYVAAASASILCTSQGAGELTFTCYGDEPSENIPISVLILS